MSPLEEDPLHPITPVLKVRPSRPVQVPLRVLRALTRPSGWQGPDRRRRDRPPPEANPPETYDEHGTILHPHHPGEDSIAHVDLEG